MVLSLIFLTLIITLFTSYHIYHRFRYNLPPGRRPLPFISNIYDLKPVLVRCFAEWADTYGPIFSVYFGSQLNVVVNSPELAKQVLKDNDDKLANRNRTDMINKISKKGTDMIWSDYGPHYVKVRKLCTLELFTAKRVEALRPIREDEVTALVEAIYKDSPGKYYLVDSGYPNTTGYFSPIKDPDVRYHISNFKRKEFLKGCLSILTIDTLHYELLLKEPLAA